MKFELSLIADFPFYFSLTSINSSSRYEDLAINESSHKVYELACENDPIILSYVEVITMDTFYF